MNYINDLAYASHIAQAKKLAKDKRQKKKYSQMALLATPSSEDNSTSESEISPEESLVIAKENDRRTGQDRRKNQEERGRYVESRLQKNRRYKKEVSLIV
ncbi:hypothetical protein Q4503_13475 [Colwellia sp. 6_MG-2023]|uniref:hypothetical protein n=1 Tax=Colwellia sp. 6_MG-2023 TaxID=3062676 RepID=UPI0026E118E1|nr:hypothetical protein [Colwellia sp. 6_MG-2023]MDO6488711.1 hypothetical protein [Colwellia sp. 6_MG-2023]